MTAFCASLLWTWQAERQLRVLHSSGAFEEYAMTQKPAVQWRRILSVPCPPGTDGADVRSRLQCRRR
jgi:hypothetical protein